MGGVSYLLPLLFCLDSNDPRFTEVEQLQCPHTHRTLIITYIGLRSELEKIHTYVNETYGNQVHTELMKDHYIKDHYFLEFSHCMANKQEGLMLWSKLVGCEATEVTVFGDNLNDISLFRAAGKKMAVGNAHPEILDMADSVIESNDQ